MSAVKLTVIFTPAISRGDYLAKSAEKANALGLTINHGEGPDNRRVWLITHDGYACGDAISVAETQPHKRTSAGFSQ
jgi:hypothetical protein